MLQAKEAGPVRAGTRPAARRSTGLKTKTEKPSASNASDGFLNHHFPVLIPAGNAFATRKDIEKYFFASLNNLAGLYSIQHCGTTDLCYPENIRTAFRSAEQQLTKIKPGLQLVLLQTEDQPAGLSTVKTLDTRMTLFYIPVENLYRVIRSKKCRRRADLLLSCLAYFHLAGGIPFYSEAGNFVGGQYEMISDWTINEPDEWEVEDYKNALRDLRLLSRGGNNIYRSISKPFHLAQLQKRVAGFRATTAYDKKLIGTARKILSLYQKNGARSIFASVIPHLINPADEERIYAEQYISFCWSDKGWIADHLHEMVNAYFQECATIEEPCSIQLFSKVQALETHDLRYEKEFLDQLCGIIDLLIELQ